MLPAGLTLNSTTGAITGVPTTATFTDSFTVTVTDSSSPPHNASQIASILIAPTPPMDMFCPNPGTASLGAAFYDSCSPTGGNSPYTVSIVAGELPPGLTMKTNGQLTGTPTAMGTFSFTAHAVDSSSPPAAVDGHGTITVGSRAPETGLITITATSGGIVNTTTLAVTVP
jgi:hypothetical protein